MKPRKGLTSYLFIRIKQISKKILKLLIIVKTKSGNFNIRQIDRLIFFTHPHPAKEKESY